MYSRDDEFQRKIRGRYLFLASVVVALLTCSSAYSQSVVLYEGANYAGRSISLDIGTHRFFTREDFNDVANSIKVPPGLAAMLCEHADEGGGYGKCIDLLEDCPDLSVYAFNDIASYVNVFSTNRPGFVYVRNSIQNGQFVPGHWEGTRVPPRPVNHTAVVSPPFPPHRTNAVPTVMQVNGAQSTITTLGEQSSGEADLWEHAERDQLGVIGSDYRGMEELGSAAFERASESGVIPPDSINFWYPQKELGVRDHRGERGKVYFKRTLVGQIADTTESREYKDEDGNPLVVSEAPHIAELNHVYIDHDFNLDIRPAPKYMYLITRAHPPTLSLPLAVKLRGEHIGLHNLTGEYHNPCRAPFQVVESEIDAGLNAKSALNFLTRQRIGRQIGVYGPWIYDRGHCYQPEIHPAEQIWWSEDEGANRKYYLNLFCDSSKRFWWRDQMDDGTKLRPWGAPPIKGTFAIAFQVSIDPSGNRPAPVINWTSLKYEVSNTDDFNVAVVPGGDRTYTLVYQNRTLVSFVPHNDAFKVSFEQVGLRPGTNNVVQGFLVLETAVGTVTQIATRITVFPGPLGVINFPLGTDPDKIPQLYERRVFKKVEGHYMFSVLRTEVHTGASVTR